MSIQYTAVAYGATILADHTSSNASSSSSSSATALSLSAVSSSLLSQLDTQRPQRMVFSYDRHLVHFWVTDQLLVFLCMTGNECSRRVAFQYLQHVHDAFNKQFPEFNAPAAQAHSLASAFGPTLSNLAANPPADTLELAQSELASVRQVMIANIERVLERGDRIEVLVDKTQTLRGQAEGFRRQSRRVRRGMQWKNVKVWIFVALVVIVVAYLISGEVCGFPFWGRCIGGGGGEPMHATPPDHSGAHQNPEQPSSAHGDDADQRGDGGDGWHDGMT